MYGVVSLMFWSITIIVSIKYLGILMRADNDGEGGVMALAALAQRLYARRAPAAAGSCSSSASSGSRCSTATRSSPRRSVSCRRSKACRSPRPAIGAPGRADRRGDPRRSCSPCSGYGTGKVGNLFGPVMVLWFAGPRGRRARAWSCSTPSVLLGLSPTYAVAFIVAHPAIAFVAMGAVVLVITGAEALYADMGHFGRSPIRRAWFFLVFPALTLNYLGQAALVLHHPAARANPFFLLFPDWLRLPGRDPGDRRDRHRQPGRHLRRVLALPAGGAARPAAAADHPADLEAGERPDLPAGGQHAALPRRAWP